MTILSSPYFAKIFGKISFFLNASVPITAFGANESTSFMMSSLRNPPAT